MPSTDLKNDVYVAASFKWRDTLAQQMMDKLVAANITCDCLWIKNKELPFDAKLKAETGVFREYAVIDAQNVIGSRYVVFLSDPPESGFKNTTGGKHVELGIALGLGKRVVVVGQRENIFHHHPLVAMVETQEQAVELVKGWMCHD